jgi:HK97 family phage major capsid protein
MKQSRLAPAVLSLAGIAALATPKAPLIRKLSAADIDRFGKKEVEADDKKALLDTIAGLKRQLTERDNEIKAALEAHKAEIEKTGKASDETKAKLDTLAKAGEDTIARIGAFEQALAALKMNNGGRDSAKSTGEQFTDDEKVKAFLEGPKKGRVTARFKAITSATSGSGNGGELIVPDRQPGIIQAPNRPLYIRELLSSGRTTSNSIEYVQETGFTNNARPVAETTQKPESSIEFTLQTAPVRTIAHFIMASVQVLDDVPALQSYIDTRLRYGLALEEENQILAGDGTGQNLLGLIPQATPFDTSRLRIGDTRIDIIRRAMTQVRLAEYRADAIVMHPNDWEEIELTKDTTDNYVWANPASLLGPTLWGRPVIDTTAVEEGEFLVGAFKLAGQVWDRQDATVDVSTEDRDNFIKNMVTIRGEERLALTVYRPEAMVYGDFAHEVSGYQT